MHINTSILHTATGLAISSVLHHVQLQINSGRVSSVRVLTHAYSVRKLPYHVSPKWP